MTGRVTSVMTAFVQPRWIVSNPAQKPFIAPEHLEHIAVADAEVDIPYAKWYDEYAFHRVYQAVYAFCTADLSSVYFDVLKDRLYTTAGKSAGRRSAQTALWKLTDTLTRLLAPVLAFTCEEVWSHFARPAGAPDSVHIALLPAEGEMGGRMDAERLAAWEHLIAVRDEVLKVLEAARQEKVIGAPLEAAVQMGATEILSINLLVHRPWWISGGVRMLRRYGKTVDYVLPDEIRHVALEPSERLGDLRESMIWRPSRNEKWLELGRRDAEALLIREGLSLNSQPLVL